MMPGFGDIARDPAKALAQYGALADRPEANRQEQPPALPATQNPSATYSDACNCTECLIGNADDPDDSHQMPLLP